MIFNNLTKKDIVGMWKDLFEWRLGRQKTGYWSFLLFFNPFLIPFHIVLLYYPKGSYVPWHYDKVPGKRHYRLNILFKSAFKGGFCILEQRTIWSLGYRVRLFRPDINKHVVFPIKEGTRWVFSIGWVLKDATESN